MRSVAYIITSDPTSHIIDFQMPNHNIVLIFVIEDMPILAPLESLIYRPSVGKLIFMNKKEQALLKFKEICGFKSKVTKIVCTREEIKYVFSSFNFTFVVICSESPGFISKCLKKMKIPILEIPKIRYL
ncbi:hypothetical protein DMUE_3513 [Dictyocoela muelleri]|nr:hypothetical protein DMUE_3513 [Dictyocoela muelleri]